MIKTPDCNNSILQQLNNPSANIELGYWAIRGLGQPIRFLLTFVEMPFSETRLGAKADGTLITDRALESADWENHKKTIDFPFPNLPYLIDNSGSKPINLTQSNAVMRYLGRRFDLYGDCDSDRTSIDILQDEAYDFRNCIVKAAYAEISDFPGTLTDFTVSAIPRYIDRFEQYLRTGGNTTHFVGNRLSLIDFILYELIWQTSVMVPGTVTMDNRPNLSEFLKCFETIPQIARYMTEDEYIDRPINSVWAAFK